MTVDGWKETTLGNFVTLQRGHDLPDPERRSGNVPIIGSAGITGYHDTALAKGPGVTVGRSGASFGAVTYSPIDYWPHNACLYVIDFHENNERFAYYFLKSLDFSSFNSGSAQPSLNRNFIHPIKVLIPPLPEQRAIAGILGALDDKIELNRRMNRTLESMARAVFRQWFVESEEVADWEAGTVGDVVKRIPVGKKYDFKTALPEGRIPILDQAHFSTIGYHNDEPGVTASIDNPVIVFSNHRCYTDIIQYPFSAIQNVLPFVGDGVDTRWLYHATDGIITYSEYKGHYPEFISKPLVIPPEELTKKFGEFVKPLHIKIMKNKEESRTLASLRDSLLPKLMRGEVRVV